MIEGIDGKFVTVGDYISEEMEYLSEDESKIYEDDGKLYASTTGIVKINPQKRTVTIENEGKFKSKPIESGDVIIGRVKMERKFTVGILIYKAGDRLLVGSNSYGNVHVSNVSKSYIESLKEAFKSTDIVRAKVIKKTGNEFELTTVGSRLGVISSDCTVCGTKLDRKGKDFLECPFCGKKEKRKLANDYGNIEETIKF